jgi:hypothetical protein
MVLDQTRYELPAEIPLTDNLLHIPVTPNGNPDLHWNSLMFCAGAGYLLRLGVDEFISAEILDATRTEIDKHPETLLWFLRRKNWIDGIDRSDLFACGDDFRGGDPEGYDWQPALVKVDIHNMPLAVVYGVAMHTPPQVHCPTERVAFLNPEKYWIDHQRTSAMVAEANAKREPFLDERGKMIQTRFLNGLEAGAK